VGTNDKAYDDKFYDLDDDWIDDDDAEIVEELGTEFMLAEGSNFMSESASVAPDSALQSKNLNQEEIEYRKAKKLEKKEHDRIARRFKVLTADDFDRYFNESEQQSKDGQNAAAGQAANQNGATSQSGSQPKQDV